MSCRVFGVKKLSGSFLRTNRSSFLVLSESCDVHVTKLELGNEGRTPYSGFSPPRSRRRLALPPPPPLLSVISAFSTFSMYAESSCR